MSSPDGDSAAFTSAASLAGSDEGGLRPVLDDVRGLAQEAKTLAQAELAYQAARAKLVGTGARSMALYAVLALFFAFFALGGLTVGLLLALTPLVTAWGATAIVVGLLVAAASLCALRLLRAWQRLRRGLAGEQS